METGNNKPEETLETIIVEDEDGNEQLYDVDAIIEMDNKEYILYSSGNKLKMKRVLHEENDEYLLDVSEEEMSRLISSYESAMSEETKGLH